MSPLQEQFKILQEDQKTALVEANATAAQRAEAFLKTLGLWEIEPTPRPRDAKE